LPLNAILDEYLSKPWMELEIQLEHQGRIPTLRLLLEQELDEEWLEEQLDEKELEQENEDELEEHPLGRLLRYSSMVPVMPRPTPVPVLVVFWRSVGSSRTLCLNASGHFPPLPTWTAAASARFMILSGM